MRTVAIPANDTRLARIALALTILSALALIGVALVGWTSQLILPMAGDRYLLGWAGLHARPSRNFVELLVSQVPLGLLLILVLAGSVAVMLRPAASPEVLARRQGGWGVVMWLCGLAVLVLYGAAQPWYPIEKLLALQGGVPFQHRMLFALPAMAWQWALPQRPVLEGYLLSQALALAFALWANYGLACALVRRPLAIAGPAIALAAWAATLTYFTFYDLAIVGFFAWALRLLLLGAFGRYLVVFALATLNHEISLLLVPVAIAVRWRGDGLARLIVLVAAQLALYALLRAGLFALLPMDAAWQGGKPAFNWMLLTQRTQEVVFAMAPVVVFFGLALCASRWAAAPLRRALVLWPCLLLMTVSVGQLNEGRQFDAFIPLGVALCLGWLDVRLSAGAVGTADAQPRRPA